MLRLFAGMTSYVASYAIVRHFDFIAVIFPFQQTSFHSLHGDLNKRLCDCCIKYNLYATNYISSQSGTRPVGCTQLIRRQRQPLLNVLNQWMNFLTRDCLLLCSVDGSPSIFTITTAHSRATKNPLHHKRKISHLLERNVTFD